MSTPWFNQNWLIAVVTLANAAVVARQLRSSNKRNQFDVLYMSGRHINERLSADQVDGENAFYALRHHFTGPAANPAWGTKPYYQSLLDRIVAVAQLDPAERAKDLQYIERVVNVWNDIAESVEFRFIDHQKILSKYHLTIIRDVFIIEPYVYQQVIFAERGRWGFRVLQLGEMARRYNDMNPVHRRGVYFLRSKRIDNNYGPIYASPDPTPFWLFSLLWRIRRRLRGYPRITERSKRRQNRQLSRIEDATRRLRQPAS